MNAATLAESTAVQSQDSVLKAAQGVYGVYDGLLELQSILRAFVELPNPPTWAYGLGGAVDRLVLMADVAHAGVSELAPSAVVGHGQ